MDLNNTSLSYQAISDYVLSTSAMQGFPATKDYTTRQKQKELVESIKNIEVSMFYLMSNQSVDKFITDQVMDLHDAVVDREVIHSRAIEQIKGEDELLKIADILENSTIPEKDNSGYVYMLVDNENRVKIGKTDDIQKRIDTHKKAYPSGEFVHHIETINRSKTESLMHKMLSCQKIDGQREWFSEVNQESVIDTMDTLDMMELNQLVLAEHIVTKVIILEMEAKTPYRDIFQSAKEALMNFADTLYLNHKQIKSELQKG